jgi:hypothetical protein
VKEEELEAKIQETAIVHERNFEKQKEFEAKIDDYEKRLSDMREI